MKLPSKEEILAFIRDSKTQVGKREIAHAFNIRGPAKIALKALLKDLNNDGDVERGKGRKVGVLGALPPVDVIEVTHTDKDGDMFGKPVKWESDTKPPTILVVQPKTRGSTHGKYKPLTVGVGDRVLAKLLPAGDDAYEARPIKKIAAATPRIIGVYEFDGHTGRLKPVDKKFRHEVVIGRNNTGGAQPGDLVAVDIVDVPRFGPQHGKVVEVLGQMDSAKNLSLIAIHQQGIPHIFSDAALKQAKDAKAANIDTLTLRQALRHSVKNRVHDDFRMRDRELRVPQGEALD